MNMNIYQRNQLWASLSQELVKANPDSKSGDKVSPSKQPGKAQDKRDKKV